MRTDPPPEETGERQWGLGNRPSPGRARSSAGQGQGGVRGLGRSLFRPGVLLGAHLTASAGQAPPCTPGSPGRILATATPPSPSQRGPAHTRQEWRLTLGHLEASRDPHPGPGPHGASELADLGRWWVWGTGSGAPLFWVPEPEDPEPAVGRPLETPCPEKRREARRGLPDPALCSPPGVGARCRQRRRLAWGSFFGSHYGSLGLKINSIFVLHSEALRVSEEVSYAPRAVRAERWPW